MNAVALVTQFATLGQEQVSNPNRIIQPGIVWSEMEHCEKYSTELLEKSPQVRMVRKVNTESKTNLAQCVNSGCLIRVLPGKNVFEILIFPDHSVRDFDFRWKSKSELMESGIDVVAIESFLCAGRGLSSKSKFRLVPRIEAHIESQMTSK